MNWDWFDKLIQDFFYFYGTVFFIVALLVMIRFLLHRRNPGYSVAIAFRYRSRRRIMSDVVIPLPGPAEVATAVISDLNGPVAGAVFDSQPTWSIDNPAVATISPVDLMNELVTGVAAGAATLTLTGVYQGFTLTAQANITVTLVNGGFSVAITWAPATPAPK